MTIAPGAKVLTGVAWIHCAEATAPAPRNCNRRRGRRRRKRAKRNSVVQPTIVARSSRAMTAEPSADAVGARRKAKGVCVLAIRRDLFIPKVPVQSYRSGYADKGLSPATPTGATKRARCTTDTPPPCEACSQETNCGYCKTSTVGGCVAGSGSSSTSGRMSERRRFVGVHPIAQCAANNLEKIPTGKKSTPMVLILEIKLIKRSNLRFRIVSERNFTLRSSVDRRWSTRDILATIRTLVPSDKNLILVLASLDEVPTVDKYMAKAVVPPVDPNGANDALVLHFGLCGNAGSKVLFHRI